MESPLSPCFVIFICTILKKISSMHIFFFIRSDKLMILFILVLPNNKFSSLQFLVNLIDHFIQFTLKIENDNFLFLFFLEYWFLSTLTGSQQLFSENPSQFPFLLKHFLIILLNRKWLFFILMFIVLYTFVPILSISPMNLIKFFVVSQCYNPYITDKTINKFKKPENCYSDPWLNIVILHFYFSISFKITKSLHNYCFKTFFKSASKIKLYHLQLILFLLRSYTHFQKLSTERKMLISTSQSELKRLHFTAEKLFAVSQCYNPYIIDKTMNKFKKPESSATCLNIVILHFYFSISFKISKIPSQFGFKTFFKSVNKIKFYHLQQILFLLRSYTHFQKLRQRGKC